MRLLPTFSLAGALIACALVTAASPATASVLTGGTRFYAAGVPGAGASADYVSNWNALAVSPPTSGYADVSMTDWGSVQNPGGSHSNIATHYQALFYAGAAGLWTFRTSFDSGWGGTMLADGVELQTRSTDMWWNGDWSDPAQHLEGSLSLSVGNHVLDIYGLEGCCDGPGQGQFSGPATGGFRTFSTEDGLAAVPEPISLAILTLGVAGLGVVRNRRHGR